MRRILVTGSRNWEYPFVISHDLAERAEEYGKIIVVHGDCPTGADAYAKEWANNWIMSGMKRGDAKVGHEPYPALWDWFGKDAGPIRNRYMVQLGADECLAYPTATSVGTIGCMNLAQAAGIPVINHGTIEVPGFAKDVPW